VNDGDQVGLVRTVSGDIGAAAMGRVLAHEHLFIDLYRVYQPHRDMALADRELMRREVQRFVDSGGGTIVDLTTPDLGRDPGALAWLARATGVSIVMGTGHYREPFYEVEIDRTTVSRLTEQMIDDIRLGVHGIRPGVIGEIGTDGPHVSAREERVHRAAARAAVATGLSVVTHSLASKVGDAQMDLFEEEGLPATRVAIGHADTVPDWQYHRHLIERGAWIVYDTVRGMNAYELERTTALIEQAIDEGLSHHILLSHDVCANGHLHAYGGKGLTYIHDEYLPSLAQRGLPAHALAGLAGENAQRFFALAAPAPA